MASQSGRNNIAFIDRLKKGGEIEKSSTKVNRNIFFEPYKFGFLIIKWIELMKCWTSLSLGLSFNQNISITSLLS